MTPPLMSHAEMSALEAVEIEACSALFEAAPAEIRASFGISHGRDGAAALLAAKGVPVPVFNRVVGLGAGEPATEAQLERTLEWMRTSCAPSAQFQIAPGALPLELPGWLAARGVTSTGTGWARLWRRSATVPQHPVATSLTIRPLDGADAASFGDIVARGFGMPPALAPWFAAVVGKPGYQTYLAYDGDQPVAAGALYLTGTWGWLGFGTTLAEFRGRGAQSALLARRISDGLQAGATGFTTETGAPPAGEEHKHPSYRNILRAGFEVAYVRQNYRQEAVAAAAS